MGQKVIPTSFRLNKNENWNSNWIVEKKKYSKLLHLDLEIRSYFEKVFNFKNFKLAKLNILKQSKNIYIYVYYHKLYIKNYKSSFFKLKNILNLYYKEHNIKLFIKRVRLTKRIKIKRKKNVFKFFKKKNKTQKYYLNYHFKKFVFNFLFMYFSQNIEIFSNFIKQQLQRRRIQKKQIYHLNNNLEKFHKIFKDFIGYRLQFKGRLNKSKRKQKKIYQKGKIALSTIKHNIQYSFNEFRTPSGICSIKLWLFFNNNVIPPKNKI